MITRILDLYTNNKIDEMGIYNSYKRNYITQQEWDSFYSGLQTNTFSKLKIKKLLDLEIWADGLISAGYEVPNKGFNLGMTFDDRNAFTQQLLLVQSLISGGDILLTTELTVVDITKTPHTLTAQEILNELPSYGVYVNTVWSTKTGYEDYINSLTESSGNRTILENISFSI